MWAILTPLRGCNFNPCPYAPRLAPGATFLRPLPGLLLNLCFLRFWNASARILMRKMAALSAHPSLARKKSSLQRRGHGLALATLAMPFFALPPQVHAQGPPYQTDDPVPVDLHHYEFYIFGGVDGTPAEMDSTGPAFEFNWGALPRVQLHAILPWGVVAPSNNPVYLPGGTGPTAFGLTDMELGVKIAFIKEGKHIPQIGSFTMFEMPTGNADKGLGVGKVWYKLPIWLQKNIGKWNFDGGGGYQVVPQTGYRDFPYTGWLVKKELRANGWSWVREVFAHGREGIAAAQTEASTMIDVGGYYHFKHNPNEQFLFCYGHSVAGQTENYAYVGMYWTWGKDKDACAGMQINRGDLSPMTAERTDVEICGETFRDCRFSGRICAVP